MSKFMKLILIFLNTAKKTKNNNNNKKTNKKTEKKQKNNKLMKMDANIYYLELMFIFPNIN